MPFRCLLVVMAILVTSNSYAANRDLASDHPNDGAALKLWERAAAEAPATHLLVGDAAPSFSFHGADGAWHPFFDPSRQGALMLVFGARESDLLELESARELFRDLGVTPVVFMDRRTSGANRFAQRLGITSTIVSDPKCAIADLYNSIDPLSHRHAPSFFVLDERRTIRALGHGKLPSSMTILFLAAQGLGLPLPDSYWSLAIE
jgi:peroxiredoxin